MTRKNGIITAGILLLFLLFSSPFWLWLLQKPQELNVLIVDKTVPDSTYREHQGITWLLNHLKLKKHGQETYDPKEDYAGFIPDENPPAFGTRELPEDLSPYDLLYLADTYGVYEDEYTGGAPGSRSELLYGGMSPEEVRAIGASLRKNDQTLIAEFNTFGSPTGDEARKELYGLLNVEWSGWIGRYFADLEDKEVPVWLKRNYEKQHGKAFSYKGNGLVFVSETEDKVIVLTGDEIGAKPVLFKPAGSGSRQYGWGKAIPYNYWFDIVEPLGEAEVQAEYELSLDKEGEKVLTENGIPLSFPAVIHHQAGTYDSYYFAGDFADQEKLPAVYGMKGVTWWQKLFSFQQKGRTDAFYWKAYVPMMKEILDGAGEREHAQASGPEVRTESGMKMTGRAGEQYLQVLKNGEWEDLVIKGVNMGIAKPGSFPGEAAIAKEEYARWFKQISEMNANALRIYTIHPPAFYEALYEHNRNTGNPIHLFHGVWVNEETFIQKKDAFDPAVTDDFKAEIERVVDLLHGNAELPERAGHASGTYEYDLSPYLLGWIIGVEWDSEGVVGTNEKNPRRTSFDGTYIKAEDASPFEVWLAEMMDHTAVYEAENYNWQHPMSFTNWVTTDLLEHPAEPSEKEDLVSVDPNKIKAKDNFYPGLFASYHIYPYYPDFLNYEEKYVEYIDHRGKKNNYAGYLNDMKQHHAMPLLVAEFGIPASRGMTHENVYGFNQGGHSEQEQGRMLASLFEDILEEKLAGGLIFTWQDEWFKRTWNTMDYDNPDRRPFWDNIQTNEQHFGLLSFEPDAKETQLHADGETDDWEARGEEPLYSGGKEGPVKNVFVSSDLRGLYVRIDYDEERWDEEYRTVILLDTIKGQGQSAVPGIPSAEEEGIDFVVELNGKEDSRVLVDSYYDSFYYDYGERLRMIEPKPYAGKKNNGVYHPIRLTLNKELDIEGRGKIPFSDYETGKLLYGNGNPGKKDFNSIADFYKKDGVLELRLPWLLLNVKDPSRKEIMGNMWTGGIGSSETIESISAAVLVSGQDKEKLQRVPEKEGEWMQYTWDNWEEPVYHERLKNSYNIIRGLFERSGPE